MTGHTTAAAMAALETRAEWRRWVEHPGDALRVFHDLGTTMQLYVGPLEEGETFYMDEHFCALVDHARRGIPDSTPFERAWLIRPAGFLYLATPFTVPHIAGAERDPRYKDIPMVVRAVGWTTVKPGTIVHHGSWEGHETVAGEGWIYFRCYLANADYRPGMPVHPGMAAAGGRVLQGGFSPWSYFVLQDGQPVQRRIDKFEDGVRQNQDPDVAAGAYSTARGSSELHEIRWIYTAMHLMAQRLAARVRHQTERHARRRLERAGRVAPPFVEVVTLRRLQAERPAAAPHPIAWQCQWEVRGHWRNQWYRREGIHKPKFIAAFVKGPADKPFKEPGTKLFIAAR